MTGMWVCPKCASFKQNGQDCCGRRLQSTHAWWVSFGYSTGSCIFWASPRDRFDALTDLRVLSMTRIRRIGG